VAKFYRREG